MFGTEISVVVVNFNSQALKAMYGVIRKIKQFNLPLECQLDLFDRIVVPVHLFGCEYGVLKVSILLSVSI